MAPLCVIVTPLARSSRKRQLPHGSTWRFRRPHRPRGTSVTTGRALEKSSKDGAAPIGTLRTRGGEVQAGNWVTRAALAIVNDVRRVSALRRRPDRLPQPPDASTSGRSRSSASGHRVSNVGLTEVALFQGGFTGCAGVAPVAPFVALPSSFCRRSAGERGAEQVGEGAPMAGLGVGVIDRIVQHRKSVEGTIGLDRVIETRVGPGHRWPPSPW